MEKIYAVQSHSVSVNIGLCVTLSH